MNIPYATAYHALFNRAHGSAGETVLVHGASGGVGIGAVQLARARGLTVIGTAGTERGRKMVAEQGAHHVLDHGAPGYLEECVRLTGGRGPDVIMVEVDEVSAVDVVLRPGEMSLHHVRMAARRRRLPSPPTADQKTGFAA